MIAKRKLTTEDFWEFYKKYDNEFTIEDHFFLLHAFDFGIQDWGVLPEEYEFTIRDPIGLRFMEFIK